MKAKSKWLFFQISECCCLDTPEEEMGDEESMFSSIFPCINFSRIKFLLAKHLT